MVDIPSDTKVWLAEDMTPSEEGDGPSQRVDKLAEEIDPSRREEVHVRDTERGELSSELTALRVHTVEDNHPSNDEEWLVTRRDKNKDETKYYLSNAPPEKDFDKLVKMSATRDWIERAIEDGKGEMGMGDYEVRKWRGWHHHMTMTMVAMLLLLEMRIDLEDKMS